MSADKKRLLSIIVPVYQEAANLDEFRDRLLRVIQREDYNYEVVFVNDGSTDGSAEKLDEYAAADSRYKVIHFCRNFGQQPSIRLILIDGQHRIGAGQ